MVDSASCIAIIPARGGSKRIPKKNIVDFNRRPMLYWTLEAARKSGCFEKILVSTDDKEIAQVAHNLGFEVPFLRNEAADDISPVSVATLAALEQAENFYERKFDTVVQLMPNCPLRTSEDIKKSIVAFGESNVDFQLSAVAFDWLNPWWSMTLDAAGHGKPLFSDVLNQRSQDLEELYCPTGSIWIANSKALKKSKSFYGPQHVFRPISKIAAVDIDTLEDLEFAKILASAIAQK